MKTLETYNNSSAEFSEYFRDIGPRGRDMQNLLDLAGVNDGTGVVLEIGCGDGRDAGFMAPLVAGYTGIDYSESFIDLAQQRLPGVDFRVEDMVDFDFGEESLDVILAFASLLHLDINDFSLVLQKSARALRGGGVMHISVKEKPQYESEVVVDNFGERLFYSYNEEVIRSILPEEFTVVQSHSTQRGKVSWLDMVIQKNLDGGNNER
jgi:SAM-dependent methyltransferase